MEQRSKSRLTEWLDRMAQESWQLELIISGFAIFLLAGIYEPLEEFGYSLERLDADASVRMQFILPYLILMAAWFILLVNLCVHVLFRGLWISTIGLRSVSDDIDFEKLRMQPRFDRFLRRRIGSFDRYIERLENICSVLFAFTFLILFMLLAVGGILIVATLINLILEQWLGLDDHSVKRVVNILMFLGSILYFIDFVTLAQLKRVRWFAPIYFPIYRFFSLITFAALYRPLYYNLIDNRFGRTIGFLLVPYILFLMVITSVTYNTNVFFPEFSNKNRLDTEYYDDLRPEDVPSQGPSIPSRFIDNGFIELFIPYNSNQHDRPIQAVCPDLDTVRTKGFKLGGVINVNDINWQANIDSLLLCMGTIHRIYVGDSLLADPNFHFYTHPQRKENGLLTVLDLDYLFRGEHLLRVETQRFRRDSLVWQESARIPFWKE